MVKKNILAALFLTLISFPNRLFGTINGLFAFTYDQGRDLLEVSKIVWNHNFTLIGPTTGLAGIFYGPWWYYFLTPIFVISNGDPQKIAYVFSFIGILTTIMLYLFLKKISGSFFLAICLATIASISASWMFGPTLIWSPTLTPTILIAFLYCAFKIFANKSKAHFFLLGITVGLVLDTTAAFGSFLTVFVIFLPVIFRKTFLRKRFLLTILGLFLVALPRIIFEIKNNFLMSKAALNFIFSPKIYGGQLTLVERTNDRIGAFISTFSSAFAKDNNFLLLLELLVIVIILFVALKKEKVRNNLTRDSFFKFLVFLLSLTFIFFTIYPDRIWGYYLVGMPTIAISILALILKSILQVKHLQKAVIIFLLIVIGINLDSNLFPPYKVTWEGDGATYKNPKDVIDYLVLENPHNFSLYFYTPSLYDYPMDYLVAWQVKKGKLEQPKDGQRTMYLVIRDPDNKQYLKLGWYGDKTKDKTKVEESKNFVGNFLLEKHTLLE